MYLYQLCIYEPVYYNYCKSEIKHVIITIAGGLFIQIMSALN